jgi:hypothetical protein
MDQGMMNEAIDEFLELTESQPEFALEPEKELALIVAMVDRRKFVEAVGAYERFYELCRKDPEMQSRPFAVNALIRCGDVFMQHLDQPKEAFLSYRKVLQSEFKLTDIQKKRIIEKAEDAKQMAKERSNAASLDIGNGQPQRNKVSCAADVESLKPVASIPLQERIRLIQPTKKPPRYPLGSIAPWEAGSVIPVPGGMDVRLGSHEPLRYDNIFLICTFDLLSDPSNEILADIFIGRRQRPYRIFSSRINYSRFLSKISTNNLDNFRSFILHMIGRVSSVFLDRDTLIFLKTRKIKKFSKDEEALSFQKNLWQQIFGMLRAQCEKCGQARWVDGRKIPPEGARLKCLSCAHSFDLNAEKFNQPLVKQ